MAQPYILPRALIPGMPAMVLMAALATVPTLAIAGGEAQEVRVLTSAMPPAEQIAAQVGDERPDHRHPTETQRLWPALVIGLAFPVILGSLTLHLARINRRLRLARDDLSEALTRQQSVNQELLARLEELRASQDSFDFLTEAARDAIVMADCEGRVTYWNASAERLFGYTAAEILGTRVHDWLTPPELRASADAGYVAFAASGAGPVIGTTRELEGLHRDGHRVPIEISIAARRRKGHWEAIGILRDITERRLAEARLRRLQSSFSNVVVKNRSGILVVDRSGLIRFSNPAAQRSLGRSEKELDRMLIGQPNPGTRTEYDIRRPDGTSGVAEVTATESEWDGQPAFLLTLHDVTDRKHAEEEARHQATHDALTALPNRAMFLDRLERALNHHRHRNGHLAVFFLDLDRFKEVNDTFGHRVGDALLVAVANRLNDCLRGGDLVARLGGDEFTLLADRIDAKHQAAEIAQRIAAAFSEPLDADGHLLYSHPSIGIALYPEDGETAEILIRNADTAMYEAKQAPTSTNFVFYEPERPSGDILRLGM